MNIGIRCHDFGKNSLEEQVQKVKGKGFSAVQLAVGKAIEGINFNSGCLSPGLAHHIGAAFQSSNIQIAILGCYINPVSPVLTERRKSLERFKEHIRYARDFGCSIVATETGSLNEDMSFAEENHGEEAFSVILESVTELVREAEKFGVIVGIEGVTVHTINTPTRMKRLLDEVASNNIQVVFDPVNFLNIKNYERQDEMIKEAIELFGDRIVAIHAKDFIVEDGHMKIVPAGRGQLNYKLLMKLIKDKKPFVNILLEDIKEEFMEESVNFLKNI